MKEVHLESRLERRVSFPDAPWQGIPLERAIYMKACWPYCFVIQSLGPGASRSDSLTNLKEKERADGGMSSERQSQVPHTHIQQTEKVLEWQQ